MNVGAYNMETVVHDSFNDFIVITISWAIKMMIPVWCHGIPRARLL